MTLTFTHETSVLGCETPLPAGVAVGQALAEIAEHLGRAARSYFVARHVRGEPWKDLKNRLSDSFGLTDRQMSSVAFLVDGKAKGVIEGMKVRQQDLARRLASAERAIAKWERRIEAELAKDRRHREWRGKAKAAAAAGRKTPAKPKSLKGFRPRESADARGLLRAKIHHKRRRTADLGRRLEALRRDLEAGRVRLCFGSRKLFREQFRLAENGHADHAAWLSQWRAGRASEIFCIGSKDEARGSQTASWQGDGRLRLRVPPALEVKYGKHLVLLLKAFRREGVQDRVDHIAWRAGTRDAEGRIVRSAQGLSWRLVRRESQHGETWVAQVTFDKAAVPPVSDARLGAWGADLNADNVAMVRVDRFGNPVERRIFRFDLRGKSKGQIAAILGEAAAWAVANCLLPDQAARDGSVTRIALPLIAEKLDFQAKKATLRERGAAYARMLSLFAYSAFNTFLDRRAAASGIEVRRVNPAFTSVIGRAKFASGYAMSVHHAAACAIARRGLRFSERIARRQTDPHEAGEGCTPSGNAFPLPARTRGKHVWSDWRRHSSMLGKARLSARTPVDEAGGRRRRRSDPSGPDRSAGRDHRQAAQSRRQPAKPFRWRAAVSGRLS